MHLQRIITIEGQYLYLITRKDHIQYKFLYVLSFQHQYSLYYTNGYYYTGQGDGNFFHGRRGEDSYLRKTNDSQITFLAIGGGGGMESFYTNNEQRTKTSTNYWGQSDAFDERDGGSGGGSGDHYTGVQSWVTHNTGGRCTQGNFGGYGYGNSGGGRMANGVGPHNGPYNRKSNGEYPSGNGGGDGVCDGPETAQNCAEDCA